MHMKKRGNRRVRVDHAGEGEDWHERDPGWQKDDRGGAV